MSNAIFGKGSLLEVDLTGGGSYTTIGEAKTITGPTFEAEEVDVTNQSSPGDFREFIRGLIDAGELTFEVNFQPDDATHAQLFADLKSGVVRPYRVHWTQMTTPHDMRFSAFVKSMPITNPVDNVLSANITLRVSGEPVIAPV